MSNSPKFDFEIKLKKASIIDYAKLGLGFIEIGLQKNLVTKGTGPPPILNQKSESHSIWNLQLKIQLKKH